MISRRECPRKELISSDGAAAGYSIDVVCRFIIRYCVNYVARGPRNTNPRKVAHDNGPV